MNSKIKHFIELNISVVLISTAAVLVRFIELPPTVIAFWRGILAVIFISIYLVSTKTSFKINNAKERKRLFASSLFFAAHWITYFYALQTSGVAIGILSMYTFPAITTIMEPFFFKTKFNSRHLILALVALLGLYVMSPELDFNSNTTKGITSGVLSAIFYSLRNLLMKSNSKNYDGSILMFYQFLFVAVIFLPFGFAKNDTNKLIEFWPYLLGLGIFTSAIGHTFFIRSLKYFEVSTASIIASSQPVIAIILGVLFLNEIPNNQTIVGGVLILSSVFIESYLLKKPT